MPTYYMYTRYSNLLCMVAERSEFGVRSSEYYRNVRMVAKRSDSEFVGTPLGHHNTVVQLRALVTRALNHRPFSNVRGSMIKYAMHAFKLGRTV